VQQFNKPQVLGFVCAGIRTQDLLFIKQQIQIARDDLKYIFHAELLCLCSSKLTTGFKRLESNSIFYRISSAD